MSHRPFRCFFNTATGLQTGPHDYQADLAERERLPDILAVPTGCGKTAAAVLSWAWRRRECPDRNIRQSTPRRLELAEHLSTAEREARQLASALVPEQADKLATAGRWHDIGKALERDDANGAFSPFQEMLRKAGSVESGHPRDGVDYAKSNGRRGGSWRGQHQFRHEVASALAYLAEENADDLVGWLVMAHHGKVRMTPTPWNDQRMDDVAGVRPDDRIPARAMSLVAREEASGLDPDLLLPSVTHPGWQGRAVKLLAEHGPQFLAYLEALVRVADWRASR